MAVKYSTAVTLAAHWVTCTLKWFAAMHDAITRMPVVNEGWFLSEREQAAEELLDYAFQGEEWVGGVRFCLFWIRSQ